MPTPTREQLASIEWAGPLRQGHQEQLASGAYTRVPVQTCPVCSRKRGDGHAEWCWLAACLAAPPPEPQAMPPIEKGDWVEDSIRIRRVRTDHDIRWLNSGDAEATRAAITEIRKANGTVWTREPRR